MKLIWKKHVHFERLLFVCGDQNAGKSRILRNMFRDSRLGTKRKMPLKGPVTPIELSNERALHIQLSSPHERKLSLKKFFIDIDWEISRASKKHWRFNYACALQPQATHITPSVVDICDAFRSQYQPERIRVVQLHPTQDGSSGNLLRKGEVRKLWAMNVEVVTVDGRRSGQPTNGFIMADYFDFT